MSMFTALHDAIAKAFGIGHKEAAALVTEVETHLAPRLADFRTELIADLKDVASAGQTDARDLLARVEAAVTRLEHIATGQPAPAPAEPTTSPAAS